MAWKILITARTLDEAGAGALALLKQSGAAPITIDYRMAKLAQGWKVYDVVVDGVSLITTYRGSFAEQVNSSGLDGLVKMLVDKNAELRAKSG